MAYQNVHNARSSLAAASHPQSSGLRRSTHPNFLSEVGGHYTN